MSGEDPNSIEISISEIYDRLQHIPAPVQKNDKNTEEFREIQDDVNENRIRKACTEVSGDIDYMRLLNFKTHPVAAGLKAIKNESVIYTDTPLMRAALLNGIAEANAKALIDKPRGGFDADVPLPKKLLKAPEIICAAEHPKAAEFAQKYNVSQSMAGFMILKEDIQKSIVIIGKDDAALLSVCRMAERGILPYLVLGFPAGINTQSTSKEYLVNLDLELPRIVMSQTKGGVETAAACLIELMKIYEDGI